MVPYRTRMRTPRYYHNMTMCCCQRFEQQLERGVRPVPAADAERLRFGIRALVSLSVAGTSGTRDRRAGKPPRSQPELSRTRRRSIPQGMSNRARARASGCLLPRAPQRAPGIVSACLRAAMQDGPRQLRCSIANKKRVWNLSATWNLANIIGARRWNEAHTAHRRD
jgi:hypothetical protein